MSSLLPREVVVYVYSSARYKAKLSAQKLALMSIMGGAYVALGALLATVVAGGALELGMANPGLQKFVFGAVFPVGLILVTMTGVDLFTSDCAIMTVAAYHNTRSIRSLIRVWISSWVFNFVGALVVVYFFSYLTHMLTEQPWTPFLIGIAKGKLSNPFYVTFFKGIVANWLVCLASWQGYASKDSIGRMVGIWLPVMAFVALGMEHSVANMFFIPAAFCAGLEADWVHFFIANLLPATLGNIVGGALFVGMAYAYLFLPKDIIRAEK